MEHSHNHTPQVTNINKAFIFGISINLLYVLIEFSTGLYYNSLSLISDAGHNLSDVAALALALLAFRLTKVKANDKFTYGYRKSTILVSLINSVVLFITIGAILWESISRLKHTVEIPGASVAIIAGIGIFINGISALMFFRDKEHDLNIKGAYLHLMADAAISLGVVISGVLISFFHIYWLDTLMSIIIVAIISYSTWNLFKDSLYLTLDGVPKGIDLQKVISEIKEAYGVIDVHHVHVWAMSTSENALTAHIIIKNKTDLAQLEVLKKNIKHKLEHLKIQHATLEFEAEAENCVDLNEN
jgi:cobalt-zinc-cadmium efflux system protein